MVSERPASALEKLLPVIVGAILGVVPVIANTALQARSNRTQALLNHRLSAVKDFSTACTRRVQLAKRVVFLGDLSQRGPWSPEIQQRLIESFETLNRDLDEARISFQAQLDFSNAVFGTQLEAPPEEEPSRLPTFEEIESERNTAIDNLRAAIPSLAKQCADATRTFTAKLQD